MVQRLSKALSKVDFLPVYRISNVLEKNRFEMSLLLGNVHVTGTFALDIANARTLKTAVLQISYNLFPCKFSRGT